MLNEKIHEKIKTNMTDEIQKRFSELQISNQNNLQGEMKSVVDKIKSDFTVQVAKQNSSVLKTAFEGLRYEAVLNKCQY